MQKGVRLFNELTKQQEGEKKNRRGRSEELINSRNQCLLYRYYFYSRVKRIRYEDVLNSVSREFFISTRTIINMVSDEQEALKEVFNEKLSVKELTKRYSFLNWKDN